MTLSNNDPVPAVQDQREPKLPTIWIGYLLGVATIVAELVAVALHPELAKEGGIAPLYLFLVSFVGGVYWLVCIYGIHVALKFAPVGSIRSRRQERSDFTLSPSIICIGFLGGQGKSLFL